LVDAKGKPDGGKWSFDTDNRKRLPRKILIPAIQRPCRCAHVTDAIAWVEERFPGNYGRADTFDYPITHQDACAWLDDFLENRFTLFGDYEDAMALEQDRLFHSVLTPMLNIGLLTPADVLDAALPYAAANGVPLNSLEGFLRQIIGWREFIRALYVREGRRQRTGNALGFTKTLPKTFWTGGTGLIPMDTVIRRVLNTAYCHHIERLMVAGNLMLLCEIRPDSVYSWFMGLFIDAYDWVMVPNVYGMSQYADGGLMTTKPYVSGSAYLRRMGDWPAGDWTEVWDGLYWRFVDVHRDVFSENHRVGLAPLSYDRMSPARKTSLRAAADGFLETMAS
jgi:deoxyribodipyrimidine photolyase-related protein